MMSLETQQQMRDDSRRKKLFAILSFSLVSLVGGYVSLVNMTAWNGALWQEAEKRVLASSNALSTLESEYLMRKQRITLALAYQNGFEDTHSVIFVPGETKDLVTMR
jgi:hypothetical protein